MTNDDLQLPSRVNVEAAHEMLDRIASRGGISGISIDASDVADIDGPAVVSIAALACAAAAAGEKIMLKRPTEPLLEAFSDLGLGGDLEKMEIVR